MELFTSENLVALLTLTLLEIVLGVDNIVFIAILVGKLPEEQQRKARFIGLSMAMILRILLLLAIGWIMGLTKPLFEIASHRFTGRDLILLGGGIFLIYKATHEIHSKLERRPIAAAKKGASKNFASALVQILLLDIVFSLDSVITAVGMAKSIPVMVAAVVIAVLVMLIFAGYIARFIERHPSLKMLALSFLLLIGVALTVDGFSTGVGKAGTPVVKVEPGTEESHGLDKKYIYAAMGFALFVELLNLRANSVRKPEEDENADDDKLDDKDPGNRPKL